MDGQGIFAQNCGVDGLLGGKARVIGEQHLGSVGLTFNVNQESLFAFASHTGG